MRAESGEARTDMRHTCPARESRGVPDAEAYSHWECYVRRFLGTATIPLMAKRFRFSMRWLLVFFSLFGAILYVLFVRPTAVANQFADRVNRGQLSELMQLHNASNQLFPIAHDVHLSAKVLPRDWYDWRHFQRTAAIQCTSSDLDWGTRVYTVRLRLNHSWMEGDKLQR